MKTHRFYFNADEYDQTDGDGHDGEGMSCHTLKYHLDELLGDVLTHVRLYPAAAIRGTGDFYCAELGFHGNTKQLADQFDRCGKGCDSYAPANGTSGRCTHSRAVYEPLTDKAVLLLRDGSVQDFPHKGFNALIHGTPAIDMSAVREHTRKDTRSIVEIVEEIAALMPKKTN